MHNLHFEKDNKSVWLSGNVTLISILDLKHVPGYVTLDTYRSTNFILFEMNVYIPTATRTINTIHRPIIWSCDARYKIYTLEVDASSRVSIKKLHL